MKNVNNTTTETNDILSSGIGLKHVDVGGTLLNETWKDIPEFDYYQISSYGRVKRKTYTTKSNSHFVSCQRSERILKNFSNPEGYILYKLYKENGENFTKKAHILVAQNFVPNPENKREVNHKDGNKANNYFGNLEWNTKSENVSHAYKTDLTKKRHRGNTCCIQLSLDGFIVDVHNSILQAGEQDEFHYKAIYRAIQNNKPYKSYLWR